MPLIYSSSLSNDFVNQGICSLTKRDNYLIVGQNVSFDLKFIYKSMDNLDIKPQMDRRYLELMGLGWWAVKDTDIPGISLSNFCSHFGVSNIGAHSALIDCRRTLEVYRKLAKIHKI